MNSILILVTTLLFPVSNSVTDTITTEKFVVTSLFSLEGGFYSSNQILELSATDPNAEIYYTLDGSEPTRQKNRYQSPLKLDKTLAVRARSYTSLQDSSYVETHTFFIGERIPLLPVVSIVTDSMNLFSQDSGIYVNGANSEKIMFGMPPMDMEEENFEGMRPPMDRMKERDSMHQGFRPFDPPMKPRSEDDSMRMEEHPDFPNFGGIRPNYEQDWKRRANMELFDETQQLQINKEIDIAISGNITRNYPLKSLKLIGNEEYGNNRFEYSIFCQKPMIRPKSVLLRNSGQDFQCTMIRDAMIQSLACGKIDIDCQAYQPAAVYINGMYYGIENFRERNNKQYVNANYGWKKDEIYFIEVPRKEAKDLDGTEESVADFEAMIAYAKQTDLSDATKYKRMEEWIDIDELINYTIIELYSDNTNDWPGNNYKAFRLIDGGRWRWIVHDLDMGFGRVSPETLSRFLEGNNRSGNNRHAILLQSLLRNETFKQRFINQYAVQLGSIYEPSEVTQSIDSISNLVRKEFVYHAQRWSFTNNFEKYINSFKSFGDKRAVSCYAQLQKQFSLGEVIPVSVTTQFNDVELLFNEVIIPSSRFNGYYFKDQRISLQVKTPREYLFEGWKDQNGKIVSKKENFVFLLSDDIQLEACFVKKIE